MAYYAIQKEEALNRDYPGILSYMRAAGCESTNDCVNASAKVCNTLGLDIDTGVVVSASAFFVHRWRQHRAIYQFDAELAGELANQAMRIQEDEDIPTDLLLNLPYPCFSIESPPFSVRLKDQDGIITFSGRFLVTITKAGDMDIPWDALSVLAETDNEDCAYYLPIVNGTLLDSIHALNKYHNDNFTRPVSLDETRLEAAPVLLVAQMVLYLQAQNADVQSRPATKKKKGKSRNAGTKPPKVVDVGFHIGSTLRQAKVRYDSTSTGTGSSKRPHSRRGHWHRFWTGSLSEPGKRKLVVKWVAPTMIHADGVDDKAVVRKVKR